MNETDMAEMMEWQARCRDLETSKEQIREERDLLRDQCESAMKRLREAVTTRELYWERIVELEAALSKATSQVQRLELRLAQGTEL